MVCFGCKASALFLSRVYNIPYNERKFKEEYIMKENTRIEKIYKNGYDKRKDFRPISDYINEKYVTPAPGKELTKEARDVI